MKTNTTKQDLLDRKCDYVGDKSSFHSLNEKEEVWRTQENDLVIYDTEKNEIIRTILNTEERYQESYSGNKLPFGNPYTRKEHK